MARGARLPCAVPASPPPQRARGGVPGGFTPQLVLALGSPPAAQRSALPSPVGLGEVLQVQRRPHSEGPSPVDATGCPHFLPSSPASGSYQQCVWSGNSQPSSLTQGLRPLTIPLSCAHKGALCCLLQARHRLRFLAQGPASRLDGQRGSAGPFRSQQSLPWLLRLASGWFTGAPCGAPGLRPEGRKGSISLSVLPLRVQSLTRGCTLPSLGGGSPLGQQRWHSGLAFQETPKDTEEGSQGSLGTAPAVPSFPPPPPCLQVGAAGVT